ncbi:biosynthetic arginine decarboxylase [Crateriforma spongiae]|uniref:biosynthetic arginine decarboxylase n=1 Tax=Crateriforma spongiae TaxID=2724528 RepID=UPI00144662FA|nr:biosynthetic arginine decarboxylase [Crateriforma spongiae]
MTQSISTAWSIQNAVDEYGIDRWGDDYFHVSPDGTVLVSPDRDPQASVDLHALIESLVADGMRLPILVRFGGILRDRLHRLDHCFRQAIDDHQYQNRYRCVFPIKVNQQKDVVAEIVETGAKLGFGIEAGSKAELLAAIAMSPPDSPIVCNGVKDEAVLDLALSAQRLGRKVFPVIEKRSELDVLLRLANAAGVRPRIGIRVKLATRGSGRWQASGGYRSKFGLTVAEVTQCLDHLLEMGMGDCFQLLHFHVGSQIGNIRQLKSAILEAARIYVDLYRRGAALGHLDVGGGLGIDYDGSKSDSQSSMNYSMQEYANDIVYQIQTVCDESNVPHPELFSESGRSVAAQHSVLVFDTLGVAAQGSPELPDWATATATSDDEGTSPPESYEQPVHDLWWAFSHLNADNLMESFHDAQVSLDLCMNLFSGGYLPLEQRVAAENVYFALCHKVRDLANELPEMPEELKSLNRMLSDTYFANFSLFQSVPDAWAIEHLFPIMPIHRLQEEPTRHAVLGDITCDSDGKIDEFVCGGKRCQTLRLHRLIPGNPYRLGVFLVGAYQEILGDLHNLFGDTNAVHVEFQDGGPVICSAIGGDTVGRVLEYLQYDVADLSDRLCVAIDDAIEQNVIDREHGQELRESFLQTFEQYTYPSLSSHVESLELASTVNQSDDGIESTPIIGSLEDKSQEETLAEFTDPPLPE